MTKQFQQVRGEISESSGGSTHHLPNSLRLLTLLITRYFYPNSLSLPFSIFPCYSSHELRSSSLTIPASFLFMVTYFILFSPLWHSTRSHFILGLGRDFEVISEGKDCFDRHCLDFKSSASRILDIILHSFFERTPFNPFQFFHSEHS